MLDFETFFLPDECCDFNEALQQVSVKYFC